MQYSNEYTKTVTPAWSKWHINEVEIPFEPIEANLYGEVYII